MKEFQTETLPKRRMRIVAAGVCLATLVPAPHPVRAAQKFEDFRELGTFRAA
jgi:hypothetical protein